MKYRIRNFFMITVLMLVLFLLQYSVLPAVPHLNAAPDLMFILTFFFAYYRGRNAGMITGFFAGLITDIFYGQVIGFNALLFVAAAMVIGYFGRFFYANNILAPAGLLVLADLSCDLIFYFVWFVLMSRFSFSSVLVRVIIPELCMTFVAGIILLKPMQFMIRRMYMYYDSPDEEDTL